MQYMNNDSIIEKDNQSAEEALQHLSETETSVDEMNSEKELSYQKAVKFMESLKCMTACRDKVKMYRKVAEQFAALSGYKESDVFMRICKRKAKRVKEEIKKNIYERAQFHTNKAKSAADYKLAAAEFKRVKGYLDADERAVQCDRLSTSIERKGIRKIFISWGLVILGVFLLIVGIASPYPKYIAADLSMKTGHYHFAAGIYKKLDTFKDSEDKLIESRYLYGQKLYREGSYKAAERVFAKLGEYKDSAVKEAELEKLVISSSSTGDTIYIGNTKWVILDMIDGKALLLKKKALTGISYHDSLEAVTWEVSALRSYLNSEFLNSAFSEQERTNIILSSVENSKNAVYGTNGGKETSDYIFVLSMEDAMKYNTLLPEVKANTWLRSPGYIGQNAAFLTANGSIMDYGYEVTSNQIGILPAMWFDFNTAE